ncbi:hypothetical protein PWT90_06980 [Aphanocladium album]|nr:hypothetical protein PWT90_06980 [Aphanocladium album]
MNTSFFWTGILFLAHLVSAVCVCIFSQRLYKGKDNDVRGFFQLKLRVGGLDRKDLAIPGVSQIVDQGGSIASQALNTASAVVSATKPLVTQFFKDKTPKITIGTREVCVGTEAQGDLSKCLELFGSTKHAAGETDEMVKDLTGQIAKLTGLGGLGNITDRLVDLSTSLWGITPAGLANAGLVASVASLVAYVCGMLITTGWLHRKANVLAIIGSLASVAIFGLFWYGSNKLHSFLARAARGQTLDPGPSIADIYRSFCSSVGQLVTAGLQLILPYMTKSSKSRGKQSGAVA